MPRPVSTTSTVGRARAALGLTAAQLAKRSGVGLSTIQQIEQGRHPLTQEVARRLADTMTVDTSWLLYGSPNDEPRTHLGEPLDAAHYKKMYTMISTPALWNDTIKQWVEKATPRAQLDIKHLLDNAARNGSYFKVVAEFELFLRDTMKKHCPALFKELFGTATIKPPKSAQPSRKPRKGGLRC